MSVFPTGIDSFTTKVDNVDEIYAADVNGLQNSVVAIETTLGTGSFNFVNKTGSSMSGDLHAPNLFGTQVFDSSNRVVTSVNSHGGPAVSLTTTNIPEGSNLYFTNARVQSLVTGTYVHITGDTMLGNLSFDGFGIETTGTTFIQSSSGNYVSVSNDAIGISHADGQNISMSPGGININGLSSNHVSIGADSVNISDNSNLHFIVSDNSGISIQNNTDSKYIALTNSSISLTDNANFAYIQTDSNGITLQDNKNHNIIKSNSDGVSLNENNSNYLTLGNGIFLGSTSSGNSIQMQSNAVSITTNQLNNSISLDSNGVTVLANGFGGTEAGITLQDQGHGNNSILINGYGIDLRNSEWNTSITQYSGGIALLDTYNNTSFIMEQGDVTWNDNYNGKMIATTPSGLFINDRNNGKNIFMASSGLFITDASNGKGINIENGAINIYDNNNNVLISTDSNALTISGVQIVVEGISNGVGPTMRLNPGGFQVTAAPLIDLISSGNMVIEGSGNFILQNMSTTSDTQIVAYSNIQLNVPSGNFVYMGSDAPLVPTFSGTSNLGTDALPFSGIHVGTVNNAIVTYQRFMEQPSGTTNGSNPTFTLTHAPFGNSLMLFENGLLLIQSGVSTVTNHYSLSGTTITFNVAPTGGSVLMAASYGYLV